MTSQKAAAPVKIGVQMACDWLRRLDSGLAAIPTLIRDGITEDGVSGLFTTASNFCA